MGNLLALHGFRESVARGTVIMSVDCCMVVIYGWLICVRWFCVSLLVYVGYVSVD